MKENIETKDVQRTEYLDKNGLDMLWAKVKENTHNQVEVERNRAVAKENSIIDTKADKSALDNYVLSTTLVEYAKKTDIPEVDTSDFVSKTTTDVQTINSSLGIVGDNKYIQIVESIVDEDPAVATLSPAALEFDGCDRSTIELNASDVNSNNSSRIIIEAYNENPNIMLQGTIGSDYAFQNNLTITNEGISSTDNNANHVYATDGSLADLTQYAKKSEISAGGNVDDVQVNGVSVVENKIANIKPATKESLGVVKVGDGLNVTDGTISAGNYIPYESIADDDNINYKTYVMKHNEGILFDSASGNVSIKDGVVTVKNANHKITVAPTFIWLLGPNDYGEGDGSLLFELNKNGLRLSHGDNNHVLTSYGSTIDITQYVKKTELPTVPTKTSELQNDSEFITKSVYDEKIAALEARIAALEAKHTETA